MAAACCSFVCPGFRETMDQSGCGASVSPFNRSMLIPVTDPCPIAKSTLSLGTSIFSIIYSATPGSQYFPARQLELGFSEPPTGSATAFREIGWLFGVGHGSNENYYLFLSFFLSFFLSSFFLSVVVSSRLVSSRLVSSRRLRHLCIKK